MILQLRSWSFSTALMHVIASFLAVSFFSGISYADPDDRPIIVLRSDDIRYSWRVPYDGLDGVNGLAYGKNKVIPITWGIITEVADNSSGITWDQLKDYVNTAGGEFASHSCCHSPMPTDQGYIDELTNSKADIEAHVPGYTCTTFIQPGPWAGNGQLTTFEKLNNSVGQAIQQLYSQSMASLNDYGVWSVGNVHYRYGLVWNFVLDYDNGATPDQVRTILDLVAATPGAVFVAACHGIHEQGSTSICNTNADVMKAFMDKAAELRDAGNVRLMSLRDAYNTSFSSNLNHIPDPGFELCNPGPSNPIGPWYVGGGAYISDTGGISNSRYAVLPQSNTGISSAKLMLAPGRYELTWYQRPEPGHLPGQPMFYYIIPQRHYENMQYPGWVVSLNTTNDWEQKTVLFLIRDSYLMTEIGFPAGYESGWGIDNVSLVNVPIDPAVSPSNTVVTPNPSGCTIAWNTPPDPDVTSITIRYGAKAHPITPTSGTGLASISAVPGTRQETTASFDWSQQSLLHFSIFAQKAGGGSSPPDLAFVYADKSQPSIPQITVQEAPNEGYTVSWISQETGPTIFQYQYAIGTSPSADDVIPWTSTSDSSVLLTGLPTQPVLHVSVKAQSCFGIWSATATALLRANGLISDALGNPNGTEVSVSGVVSAVYADCYYIETAWRNNGIKIQGATLAHEGDEVTVNGTITSIDGERVVIPSE